ncbi:MAG: undecaprenyl/decaprenyl-phosphate alpha-N-acetylglucosaminyl 1-phosphate transferase [Micavibrio sp.]|nr:undecaprenyl/decaprenyl-phosphate alpha-N-acetylglucosaminyl 1-phosphate transferase [Micavibrio sp.]
MGLVDAPDSRKHHVGTIPLIGGLCIFSAFTICMFMAGYDWLTYWPLYSAVALLLLTGAADDTVHLHPFLKFGMQFIAAGLLVICQGTQILSLGNLFGMGEIWMDFMVLPFSLISLVLLINAINLMDGLDGLASGICFVMCGWMYYAASVYGSPLSLAILLLMAALVGFKIYNMRSPLRARAAAFLGDAGSMTLGLMVGWFAIKLAPNGGPVALEPIAVAWVLAVPVWDECAQFYRRVCEGKHPFWPDRGHLHHNFLRAGFNDGQAVLIILVLVFITGGIGVIGVKVGVPLPVLTILWIVGILSHMALAKNLDTYPAIIKKLTCCKRVSL